PGRVKLIAGTDALRCLRFSNKVLRWYTDCCCRTPIANSAARPHFPVIGVIHFFIGLDRRSRDELLGLPLGRIYARSAIGQRQPTSAAERARAALAQHLRPPRLKDSRLAVARARSADAILRRSYERSALRAARTHAERARRPFGQQVNGLAEGGRAMDLKRAGQGGSLVRAA